MPDVASAADIQTIDNFIGGRWVPAHASDFFDVHNPAVGDVIGRTPLSTPADVDAAVRAAQDAFPAWRDTPVNVRAQVLYRFKALLEQEFESLARALKSVLQRMDRALEFPPFNLIVHTSPFSEDTTDVYHWHLEIMPKLSRVAGFECLAKYA